MKISKTVLAGSAVVVLAGVVGYLQFSSGDGASGSQDETLVSRRLLADKGGSAGKSALKKNRYTQRIEEQKAREKTGEAKRSKSEADDSKDIKKLIDELMATLSPERQRAIRMRQTLDGGKLRDALRMARDLMDSSDPKVRRACVNCLGWIGAEAMPELTELLADSDPEIAKEAFEQWMDAFRTLEGDADKASLIVEMIGMMKSQEDVDLVLMEFPPMEESVSLAALSDIIQAQDGKLAGESSREMFEHISGGEVYESPEATVEVIAKIQKEFSGVDDGPQEVIDVDANIEAHEQEKAAREAEAAAKAGGQQLPPGGGGGGTVQ